MLKSEAKCWKIERTPAKHENPIRFYSIKYKLERNHHNSLDMVTVGYWTAGFQAEVVWYTPNIHIISELFLLKYYRQQDIHLLGT